MATMEPTRNRLIDLLAENTDTYISGQTLSDQLEISRSAVWKHMKELEKDGYQIEGKPRKGYRIISFPEKVSANTVQWGLTTDWLGTTMIHRTTIDSTQVLAHKLAQEGAPHGTVVIADEQTNGRGRMERPWNSKLHKGIWMSMVLRPSLPPHQAPQLTLLTATVLADVLQRKLNQSLYIKWPNDILIGNKKVSGILTELQAEQDRIQYMVIGIGMNVLHQEGDIPEELWHKASSLLLETGTSIQIKPLIQEILAAFEPTYAAYMKQGFAPIKRKWEQFGFRLNESIHIRTFQKEWDATFLGIADDGALLVTDSAGKPEKLYSAEIDWFHEAD